MTEQLKTLKSAIATAEKNYRQSKGYEDGCESEKSDELYQMISSVYRYIERVQEDFWDYASAHAKGHVVPLDAEAMQKFLIAVGLENRYDVVKPIISNTASKKNSVIEVEYRKV